MKIGLAQINTTVGDIAGNSAKIAAFQRRAEDAGCSLVVYPELALVGYPPRDLVEKKALVDDNLEALKSLASKTRTAALVGFVDRNASPVGKPVFNAAALLEEGRIRAVYRKTLLPSYDVFDEGRYFEPGDGSLVFEREGLRFGVTICEDIWSGPDSLERRLYRTNPLDRLWDARLDWLLNISASPFSLNKEEVRQRMVSSLSGRSDLGVVYLNQVGGNDELIFDGASFVMDRGGRVVCRAACFGEDLAVYDTTTGRGDLRQECPGEEASLAGALMLGLRDYVSKCGFREVIMGLSGGIDSAVTAVLAVKALGPENVSGVLMPSAITGPDSLEDAAALARNLGIGTRVIPIAPIYDRYLESLSAVFEGRAPDVTEENIQARIRGNLLMALSNKFGCLVLSTGNKSELAMGYCTLYGDMSGGLALLGDVPKTMVYALGRHLDGGTGLIPGRIFTKPASAELRPGQKDEDSLPPYRVLDPVLRMYIEENLGPETIAAAGFPQELVAEIINRVDRNEYKRRQAPPVLRVTSKAFGMGRRLPIAQNYRRRGKEEGHP